MEDFEHLSDREILILTARSVKDQGARLNSHGERLRSLENWRWFLGGGLAVVGFLLGIIGRALAK